MSTTTTARKPAARYVTSDGQVITAMPTGRDGHGNRTYDVCVDGRKVTTLRSAGGGAYVIGNGNPRYPYLGYLSDARLIVSAAWEHLTIRHPGSPLVPEPKGGHKPAVLTTAEGREYWTTRDDFDNDGTEPTSAQAAYGARIIEGVEVWPMVCADCGRPAYYDRADDNYHHATTPDAGCFLIPSEDRPADPAHPLAVMVAQ